MRWNLKKAGLWELKGLPQDKALARRTEIAYKADGEGKFARENLKKLGMPEWQAYRNGNTRKGYWRIAGSGILTHTITNERLARAGYFS